MVFDADQVFRLSADNRELADLIFPCILNRLKKEAKFDNDNSIVDLLTFEILRSCQTNWYQQGLGQPEFTKGFIVEFKKHANRETLTHLLGNLGVEGQFAKMYLDLYLQVLINDRPIVRRELYGTFVNTPECYEMRRNVPFWAEPRDEFSRTLFFFRFCTILSQSSIGLSRIKALDLYHDIFQSVVKVEPTLKVFLHQAKFNAESDLGTEINKAISGKLSITWAIMFTHFDYMNVLRWKKLVSKDKSFLRVYIVNCLGPEAMHGYEIFDRRMPGVGYFSAEYFTEMKKRMKSFKREGRLFKFHQLSDNRVRTIANSKGGFPYHRVLFKSSTVKLIGEGSGNINEFLLSRILY